MTDFKKLVDRIAERFALRDATSFARATSEDDRKRIRAAFVTAWQKRDAAEALATSPSKAEAVRVVKESVAAALEGIEAIQGAGWKSPRLDGLAKRLHAAREQLDPAPASDADVSGATRQALDGAIRSLFALETEVTPATLDVAELRRLRLRRRVEAVLMLAVMVAVCGVFYQAFFGVRVRASNELSPAWSADRAIDGDANTDWVADVTGAWIEVQFHSKRHLRRLHLMNGQYFPDRATKDFRVDFYDHDEIVKSLSGSFSRNAEPLTLDVGDVDADRVRITTLGHIGVSPALAEITWD